MDSLGPTKIYAAILTAGVVFGLSGLVGRLLVHPHKLDHPVLVIAGASAPATTAAPAAVAIEPVTPLLAAANAQTGQQLAARQCASCHTFTEGGRAGVGPNLHGVVGRNHASMPGFNYSPSLRAKAAEPWSYEEINAFIAAPARTIPGTRMAYAGLANPQQRADVIAYLRSISPSAPAP
ncbi:MAG: cytochrome c family protein [Rhodospirillales bacterium]|jgi:cytochrome c|nr:cytochrome c family protein [Rhodospirillales bacterium]